ncbi:MAG: hypothetical protein RXS25_41845, partial [Paraburkholderia sp.]
LGPFPVADRDGSLRASGCSPLSFAYFSLRRQRKVGAAPHRGNANRPITKQGKANTPGTTTNIKPPQATPPNENQKKQKAHRQKKPDALQAKQQ